jgi:hypothetical protein
VYASIAPSTGASAPRRAGWAFVSDTIAMGEERLSCSVEDQRTGLKLASSLGMTLTSLVVAAQAGAEYAVTTTKRALTTPSSGLQQIVDGWLAYAREHTWVVLLAAVAGVLLLRWVFSAPRVR